MDAKLEASLLYDFYGGLLPASQQRVVELYVNDDLSLAEVAEILSISRQGVRDSLERADRKLRGYESALGLLAAYRQRQSAVDAIASSARAISSLTDDERILKECDNILSIAEEMNLNEREDRNGI